MSVWDSISTCWSVADTVHHLSALWCLSETWCQLLVCGRHLAPSKCAMMSVRDLMLTCWYVADTAPSECAMMSVWPSISTCWYFSDTGHHLSAHNVCVRVHANLFVCCRHWALSKCAMMSVWDSISTSWFVTDIGHHRSALWSLCETGSQLVGM